jgi:uncharacterized protein YjbJ (UPF0337 family)
MTMGELGDKTKGTANKVGGAVREKTGEVIGDREMQAKGVAQQVKGEGQKAKGEVKGALGDRV